ncbi:MAG: helix-turn-helix domain-containing protein [Candidatus Eremiobacteraeota bacterium]|nr:helix-turn-helix domain-containing protein [Candidatus Eremiobacteraeota bacterium]
MLGPERRQRLREFLTERRSRLKPADVGLPATLRRRVPGLRREEIAEIVGVSPNWYAYFEAGSTDRRFSAAFVKRVADALQLSDADKMTLFRLALPEVAAATEHFERSNRDGALYGISRVRTFSRRLLAASSFDEGVEAAAEALQSILSPTCASVANIAKTSGASKSTAFGPRNEQPHPMLAYHLIESNYAGRFGKTLFNEDRPKIEDSRDGSFSFRQNLTDGRYYTVNVLPPTEAPPESPIVLPKPRLESENTFEVHDVAINADDFWTWNKQMKSRAGLIQGVFDRGVYRGNIVAFWSEPHAMSSTDIEVVQTLGSLLELAASSFAADES